jgi:hypothetical protein
LSNKKVLYRIEKILDLNVIIRKTGNVTQNVWGQKRSFQSTEYVSKNLEGFTLSTVTNLPYPMPPQKPLKAIVKH